MAARLTTYVVVAIVAATLIAGLMVGAQRDDSSGPVDLIVHHARIYTADAHGTMAQAIAVRGNTILRVGSDRDVLRYRRPQTRVIDAHGAAVLPGFNDAHASLIASGLARDEVDLTGAATTDEAQARIATWADAHPDSSWIAGREWSYAAFADLPTKALLDAVVKDRPAVMFSEDGTAAWLNSAAVRAAGITRRTNAPADGEIVRDRRGEPTGLLRGSAVELVRHAMPAASPDARARALSAALQDASRLGITSVHDFIDDPADIELYERLRADEGNGRQVRVYIGVPVSADGKADAGAGLDDLARRLPDDPLIKTGFAHLAAGASSEQLNRAVAAIDRHSWQAAVDAPDAAAAAAALDAFEAAARANGKRDRRDRLEGVQALRQEDLARLKGGRWIASLAPAHLLDARAPFAPRGAAPSLDLLTWPVRSLQTAGARLAFGSGAPVREADPLRAIAAVISRETAPDEALTLAGAINAWTSGAAWASFDEHRKGALQPGMLADFVVLSTDIFKTPAASLPAATVEMTVMDGRIVYRRAS